jgi:NADPH:quinone reductase-like Zn-dependent oxidoreductase
MKGLYIDKYIENVNELTINHDLEVPEAYGDDILVHVKAGGIGYPDYLHVIHYNINKYALLIF